MGLILVACGITVLAVVRPWRDSPEDDDDDDQVTSPPPPVRKPSPSSMSRARTGPRPKPRATHARRRPARRVPAEPGRPEIPLPEWLSN